MAKTVFPMRKAPGLIPGQGTRSHMLQLRPDAAKEINTKRKNKLTKSPQRVEMHIHVTFNQDQKWIHQDMSACSVASVMSNSL